MDKTVDVIFTQSFNYNANDFATLQEALREDIQNRSDKISVPGIVAEKNPSDNTGPLSLSVESNVVKVLKGGAFLPNLFYVEFVEDVLVEAPADSSLYLVVLASHVENTEPRLSPSLDKTFETRKIRTAAITFIQESQFFIQSSNVQKNSIILGTVLRNPETKVIQIQTKSANTRIEALMRPWFSTIDRLHRSKQGTGVVSDTNPHGQSLVDFSFIGETSLWDTLQSNTIVTANRFHKHIMGDIFQERIVVSKIAQNDVSSEFGLIMLEHSFLDIIDVSDPTGRKYFFRQNPKRRTLDIFINNVPVNAPYIDVIFTKVHSCELVLDDQTPTKLIMAGTKGSEFVVTQNAPILVQDQELDMRPLDYFSNHYRVYIDKTGIPKTVPNIALAPTKITQLVNEQNITFDKPSILEFSLGNTVVDKNLKVQFRIKGTRSDGKSVTEDIFFVTDPTIHADIPNTTTPWIPGPNIGTVTDPRWSLTDRDYFTGRIEAQWVKSTHEYISLESIETVSAIANLDTLLVCMRNFDLADELVIAEFDTKIRYEILNFIDTRKITVLPLIEQFRPNDGVKVSENMGNPRWCSNESNWFTNSPWLSYGTYISKLIRFNSNLIIRLYFDGWDIAKQPNISFTINGSTENIPYGTPIFYPDDYQYSKGYVDVLADLANLFSVSNSTQKVGNFIIETQGYTKILGYTLKSS